MIVVEWQGRLGDRITRIKKPPRGKYLLIYEEDEECKDHPSVRRAPFQVEALDERVSDLPDPPIEVR